MSVDREDEVRTLGAVLARRRDQLLALPGCTGVAIGRKNVGGTDRDDLAITVFVEHKHDVPAGQRVPASLEGFPTDVVEQEREELELLATDPFARYDPMFSGLSVAAGEIPPAWGSIGCFIDTTGDPGNNVPAGVYLLTNQHVLQNASVAHPEVIQPKDDNIVAPPNYLCADYVQGYQTPTLDCAVALVSRAQENAVPNYPWHPGLRTIQGVGVAVPGDAVYKFGATTRFTEGVVVYVNYNPPGLAYQNVILLRAKDGANHLWVAKGDSGSISVRAADDFAIGLNFAGSPNAVIQNPPPTLPAYPAYYRSFAYDLQSQMNAFVAAGGTVTLAAPG
ncbi:hypothetical protein [Actinokineospora enzanensis]|uniref:hypothetical protein n=1 Tax=Actinokineospora enzanensis TaxID=155975 RepID=UPI0003606C8D|nr:hypothetical protein [Actinokineospora enzanensis]